VGTPPKGFFISDGCQMAYLDEILGKPGKFKTLHMVQVQREMAHE
jgi:hypothetical protein